MDFWSWLASDLGQNSLRGPVRTWSIRHGTRSAPLRPRVERPSRAGNTGLGGSQRALRPQAVTTLPPPSCAPYVNTRDYC